MRQQLSRSVADERKCSVSQAAAELGWPGLPCLVSYWTLAARAKRSRSAAA